ncbi:MAG TPA: putative Ig domain-containing protein [Blastocatellia bacterium]|nr:putative Ig domain-containing protein [Blastocatellia bacterium]
MAGYDGFVALSFIRSQVDRRMRFVYSLIFVGLCFGGSFVLLSLRMERAAKAARQEIVRPSPEAIWQQSEKAEARMFKLNRAALAQTLAHAPFEFRAPLAASKAMLSLPLPDGTFAQFRLEESPALEPGLAARFPEIKSYRGQAVDKPAMTMRCDLSPQGFHALVTDGHQTFNIHPLEGGELYAVEAGGTQDQTAQCLTAEVHKINPGNSRIAGPLTSVGPSLRNYRIAIAVTWEYSDSYGSGTNAGTVASLNTWLNAANAIYERELAIHLNLVNDTDILYTTERGFTAGTDPFTNGNVGTMLSEVRPVLRDQVGQANYDLGHVLGLATSGASGVSFIGVTCENAGFDGLGPLKGGGATVVSGAAGGTLPLGIWVHEIAHQFGANHSFNGTASNCSQRNPASAYESGGGLTIMGYSGICGADNISSSRELRFHSGSYAEINSYLAGAGCATNTSTGNTAPTVNGGADFTIPKNTPFTLTATGNDADAGDASNLTYAWEQFDAGGICPGATCYSQNGSVLSYSDANDPGTTTRPIFRPQPVSASPARTFPSLNYILNNANDPPDTAGGLQTAEELPRIARTLNFRVTVRDNHAGGGGVNEDSVTLTVAAAGPFQVTAPNTAVSWVGGSSQSVAWNVNGTNAAPVNAANVRISLSTDGGQTFSVTLLANTPNDGAENVTVPNGVFTSTARIKIEAVGNIFFDVSDANFSITPGDSCPVVTTVSPAAGNPGTSVTLTGINFTGMTALRFANNANAAFTVNSNTQITTTVPAGAVGGPITLSKTGCADTQTTNFLVFPSAPVTLAADDGSYETASNYGSNGGITYFVNRLTPSAYPATLSQVSVYFASFTNVSVGTPVLVTAGANTDGDNNINNPSFQTLNTVVNGVNQFNHYAVTPITITSGDFVVGFGIAYNASQFPALRDTTAPNQGRSYASTDGLNFSTIDSLGFPGDMPLRAQIFTGAVSCGYSILPASQNFAAAGGGNSVNVTTGAGCAWTATSNAAWITINSGAGGSGNGAVNYTVAANTGPQRSGTMTIAGQTFTVTQDDGCPAISINPATLPNGGVNAAYNQTLSGSGGTAPYTFAVTGGALPNGLSLSAAGALTGAPTAPGTFNFTVQATAANGCAGTRAYSVQINCQTITVNPDSPAAGTAGAAYSQTFTHAGGVGAVTFNLTGILPAGLSFNTGTATLSGTPTQTGTFNNIVVTATDSNNCTGSRTYSLVINCPTINVNPTNLPNASLGAPYSQQLTQTGGTGAIAWSSAGTLPNNLTLSAGGLLSGTPTTAGTFNFTARATDANGCFGERTFAVIVSNCPGIIVSPNSLPGGAVGTAYNQTLSAGGGTPGYSFTLDAGTLPAGLSLSAGGELSGTPSAAGAFNFTIKATDQAGCTGLKQYTVAVCGTITVSPLNQTLSSATLGTFYSQSFTQTGSVGAVVWSNIGALPNGLALAASTGVLSGTPVATGTFNFTIRATDANGCFGERQYTVTVNGNGLQFYPLSSPLRLLDTRAGQAGCDAPGAPIAGGTSRTQTAAGRTCNGLTIPANAKALTGNITTVQSGGGFLTLYPGDAAQPLVANSNYGPSEIVNNVFTVGLGTSGPDAGAFKIFALNTTEVVVDVTGYYAPPGAGGLYFHPLPKPVRLLETRAGFGGCFNPGAALPGDADTMQQARGVCDGVTIPPAAQAIVGNATTVGPQGGGFLTLFPANAVRPLAASSNYLAGQVMNAPFTTGLSATGAFKIYTTAQTDLVVDVLGYYSPESLDANGAGLLFNPLPKPVRLLETRAGLTGCYLTGAPLAAGSTRLQPARGLCEGVTIAANALGIIGNATVVSPQSGGFLTFWPSDAAQPTVAASNFAAGQVFNRHFTVGLGNADGAFKLFTLANTELVIDVSGFFAP